MTEQEIINKTLAMNLFEENNKSSNWFIVDDVNYLSISKCSFTKNIPYQYFQYVVLALTYKNFYFLELKDFCISVRQKNNIVEEYNREQKLDSMAILNCKEDSVIGAFSRFWLKTKIGKNFGVCSRISAINLMTKSPEQINQQLSYNITTFNFKFNRYNKYKRKHFTVPILTKSEQSLLIEFAKIFLVKV
jgi:hypothetical protein